MVTRLPTHLDVLVPPPSLQTRGPSESALLKPWRGRFLVSGTRASDLSSNVEIRVTGVETDGNIRCHIWPHQLLFSITRPHALPVLSQLQDHIRTRSTPIPVATFLPERIRDPDQNVVNQTHFRSLSRLLWDRQLVAIVPISLPDPTPSPPFSHGQTRHGMLIYPAGNSTSLLIGAIFLAPEDIFPDFVSVRQGSLPGTVPSQSLTTSGNIFGPRISSDEERSAVPISSAVLHSHFRQGQQRRISPHSYSSFRAPSVRISSHRYDPTSHRQSSSLTHLHPYFTVPSLDASRRISPSRHQPTNFPTANIAPFDSTQTIRLGPTHMATAPSSLSGQSDPSSDEPPQYNPDYSFFHNRDTSGESSNSSRNTD